MSTPRALTSRSSTWHAPAAPERRTDLTIVPGVTRAKRPRIFYAAAAVTAILGVIAAQLLVSLMVTRGAYTVQALQNTQTHVQREYQAASEALARDSSPQNLAAKAHALGMVSTSNVAYLRLSDGKVLGTPKAAKKVAANSVAQKSLVPDALLPGLDQKTPKNARAAGAAGAATTATTPFTGTLASPVTR
ncbi:MAG TPA: hypothetical protein VFQ96_03860 [Microbacteriaceae bacterium]|nr:hypothetical protein [Microbacteriaceae bacterium]